VGLDQLLAVGSDFRRNFRETFGERDLETIYETVSAEIDG
jgi:hypothetical protein